MMKSFLQTTEWLEFQKSIGRKAWRFDNDKITANIIQHDLPFKKNYLYIPHGPEISVDAMSGSIRNELSQFVSYLKNLAREQKSFYIKMEPLDDKVPELMHQFGFKKSYKELQPKRTVVLDLNKSEEELLATMHHKTRYNIKVAEKYGIIAKLSHDLGTFWKLMKKTAQRDKFSAHEKSYYEKLIKFFENNESLKVELMLAVKDERPLRNESDHALAGAIILTHGDTVYYMHGASDHEHRAMMAPYALHWGMIKYLKEQGIQKYDFWGIDAKKYPGVTRFKLGWGGREVEYPGSFDLPISKFWYYSYKLINKFR